MTEPAPQSASGPVDDPAVRDPDAALTAFALGALRDGSPAFAAVARRLENDPRAAAEVAAIRNAAHAITAALAAEPVDGNRALPGPPASPILGGFFRRAAAVLAVAATAAVAVAVWKPATPVGPPNPDGLAAVTRGESHAPDVAIDPSRPDSEPVSVSDPDRQGVADPVRAPAPDPADAARPVAPDPAPTLTPRVAAAQTDSDTDASGESVGHAPPPIAAVAASEPGLTDAGTGVTEVVMTAEPEPAAPPPDRAEAYRPADPAVGVVNGGFEAPGPDARSGGSALPDRWQLFTSDRDAVYITVTDDRAATGRQACRLTASGKAHGFSGLLQRVAVVGGTSYTLATQVMDDPRRGMSGSQRGQLSVEWLRGDEEVARDYSRDWRVGLSDRRWTDIRLTADAPADATHARLVITLYEGQRPSRGGFLIDTVQLDPDP